MKKLKLISSLAIAGLTTVTIVGCKGNEKDTTTPSTSVTTNTTTAGTTTTAPTTSSQTTTTTTTTVPTTSTTTTTNPTTEEKPTVSFSTEFGTAPEAIKVDMLPSELPYLATDGKAFLGWYLDAEFKEEAKPGQEVTESITLYARWVDGIAIHTTDDLIALSQLATASDTYVLTNDLDFTNVQLSSTKCEFTGVFEGYGHVISNASIANADSKTGILFAKVNGGTVNDVKFLGCSITSANESCGVLAGEVNGGTITKVEFNSCSATTTNNYVGLIYARSEGSTGKTVTLEEITVKNGSYVACAQYGGILCGDNTADVILRNADVEGELRNSSGNFGMLLGRERGNQTYTVEDCVVNVKMSNTGSGLKGLVTQNNTTNTTVNVSNIFVIDTPASLIGGGKHAVSATDCYYLSSSTMIPGDAGFTSLTDMPTADWYKDTLGLDFTSKWVVENDGGIKLAAASSNVASEDARVVSMKVSTSNAITRFKKGDTFDPTGLVVTLVYSDGVQLVASSDDYTVSTEKANLNQAGEYQIDVVLKADDAVSVSYDITVAEETGFKVYDEFMTHTYLSGNDLSTTNLVVKSVWSDGIEETLTSSQYKLERNGFNENEGSKYTITIKYGEFEDQNIIVSVVDSKPVVVDNKIYVNVDASSTAYNGEKVNGIETFNSLTAAIEYLNQCQYDSEVVKVIYIANGKYEEKITIPSSLTNVKLVGESQEDTIITYSAVESTVDITTGSQYGLDCATIQVEATGFGAYNLSIRNDFDYINDSKKESSPQGLALTIAADQATISNVHLYGNQDTLYLKAGRAYFYKSQIDGNIDFIFGQDTGLAYFDDCTIMAITKSATQEKNNGYVTAMRADATTKPDYGYIFNNCDFIDDGKIAVGSMSLGRPWGAAATVAYINCSFSAAYSTLGYDGSSKSRWYDMSGNLPQNADFCEYGSTGDGAITTAVNGGKVLTAEQAANYTKANIFAQVNGKCTWTAAWDCDAAYAQLMAVSATTNDGALAQDKTEVNVYVNDTADLGVYVAPWNASDKAVIYTVLDETICKVNSGVVTGLAEGSTTVTVSYKSETKVVTVNVTKNTAITEHKYTFDVTKVQNPTSTDKLALTTETLNQGFLTVIDSSKVTHRPNNSCIENKDANLSVTFQGKGTITISFASTGGSNVSRLGLINAAGSYITATSSTAELVTEGAEAGSYTVTGTTYVTVTFTIEEAGTYFITCPSSVTTRGARINAIEMVDIF